MILSSSGGKITDMRELPSPGIPDECPRFQRSDVGLYVITGTGDDHRHLCPDCLSTVARIELPRHDRRTHDPRADPANCAEAALHEAASGTDKEAALEHGLAAVNELARRVDAALADTALKIAEIATARAGAYADMYPEGAGMVAAYDDLIDELKEELIPAELEQLRANENTLDALGRQIHQLQTQLAKRRWPRVVRNLPDGPQFIHLEDDQRNALLADCQDELAEAIERVRELEESLRAARSTGNHHGDDSVQ